MSVQIRESGGQSEQPQPNVQRRLLTQKECAEKTAQALVFGLLIFAGAVALPAMLAHFFLGYLALKQFYVVAYWAGLQRRLRRGETVEIVTTQMATRGYVPSYELFWSTVVLTLAITIAALVLSFTPHLRGDLTTVLALTSLGLWFVVRYLWLRVYPKKVTRAVIRPAFDSQSTSARGYATQDSDPLAFDLEGAPQTTTASSHPVSQRKHWWTDTQLRDENKSVIEQQDNQAKER